MSKFYYNAVAGNRYEGYPVKYVNDSDEEFDFILTPTLTSSENVGNLHRHKLCNAVPGKVMNNCVFTPSAWYNFAENMTFFDPMSVNFLGRTKTWSSASQTSYANAFPMSCSGFIACNHHIQYKNVPFIYSIYPEIGGRGSYSYWGSPAAIQNSSIVEESLKKEIFNYSFSTNIEEMEEQFGMSWDRITEDSNLSAITWCRYLISSDENLDHTAKVSLARGNRASEHIVPSGFQHFYSSYNTRNEMYLNKRVANNYTYERLDDVFYHHSNGKYTTRTETPAYYQVVETSEGLPSSLNFVDEVFLLSSAQSRTNNIVMIPIYNDNDMSEFYFTVFHFNNTSLNLNPPDMPIYLAYVGAIRLYKDFDKSKWILDFSTHSMMTYSNFYLSERIGHYECDINADPWAEDTDPNGILLSYVSEAGVKEETPSIRLRKYRNYSPNIAGVIIPYLFGDNRFAAEFNGFVGTYILPKVPLYRQSFIKGNTFVCADSGSYTILI